MRSTRRWFGSGLHFVREAHGWPCWTDCSPNPLRSAISIAGLLQTLGVRESDPHADSGC